MRITVISDTHMQHRKLRLEGGDLLIHCGDLFQDFRVLGTEVAEVDEWFGSLDYERILCIGGNHDAALEHALEVLPQPFANARVLHDEAIEIGGLRFYGSPWVPDLPTHAFDKTERELVDIFAAVPTGLDVLVTHVPPHGVCDRARNGEHYGSRALREAVLRAQPRVHLFGHVHAGAGEATLGETRCINAASLISGSREVRPPVTLDL